VAAGAVPDYKKMELSKAKEVIRDMAAVDVTGISFTAGEPFLYFSDLLELIALCRELNIYTRIVQLLGKYTRNGAAHAQHAQTEWTFPTSY
jgi:organic radical activating enzyme